MIMSSIFFMPTRAISPGLSHPTDAGGGELLGCPVGQCCIPNGTTSCQHNGANAEWKGMNRGSISQAFFDKHDQLILKHCTNKIRSWIARADPQVSTLWLPPIPSPERHGGPVGDLQRKKADRQSSIPNQESSNTLKSSQNQLKSKI